MSIDASAMPDSFFDGMSNEDVSLLWGRGDVTQRRVLKARGEEAPLSSEGASSTGNRLRALATQPEAPTGTATNAPRASTNSESKKYQPGKPNGLRTSGARPAAAPQNVLGASGLNQKTLLGT